MAVLLFISILAISFTVVRIGALALELTGLDWDKAKFQALSAFSNTGYSTREAEQVASHPARRKIVSCLMVLGNAGLITLVGAFVGSVLQEGALTPLINILYLLCGSIVIVWLFHLGPVSRVTRGWVQSWLRERYGLGHLPARDILRLDQGFELKAVTLAEGSKVLNRGLNQLQLKQNQVQVLAIERLGEFFPIPRGDVVLVEKDTLIVYGSSRALETLFASDAEKVINVVSEGADK